MGGLGGRGSTLAESRSSADLRDGLSLEELTSPEVLADDVVGNLFGIPFSAGGGHMPLIRRNLLDYAQRRHHCLCIELSVGHSARLEMELVAVTTIARSNPSINGQRRPGHWRHRQDSRAIALGGSCWSGASIASARPSSSRCGTSSCESIYGVSRAGSFSGSTSAAQSFRFQSGTGVSHA